jgi:hypothetical protein
MIMILEATDEVAHFPVYRALNIPIAMLRGTMIRAKAKGEEVENT